MSKSKITLNNSQMLVCLA